LNDSSEPSLWVGIDEAGYGPNLGPLVMTAVVAEAPSRPDLWHSLGNRVRRASRKGHGLAIDDSKRVYQAGGPRTGLAAGWFCLADSMGWPPAETLVDLLELLGASAEIETEFRGWTSDRPLPKLLDGSDPIEVGRLRTLRPFETTAFRIISVHTAILGPRGLNQGLEQENSKAAVHFDLFIRLLRGLRESCGGAHAHRPCHVVADKHGGRHYYYERLMNAFPDSWIERGPEGPLRSFYRVKDQAGTIEVELRPKADGECGLVALASMISKLIRELWMDAFNGFWAARLNDLRPTAGYPTDADRFRREIEPVAASLGLDRDDWWRKR
jgi:hypothetical protein